MFRIDTVAKRFSTGLAAFARFVPPLGPECSFEPPICGSISDHPERSNRNRWSRNDLVAAIGRDPHETDPAMETWPPTRMRR